jgi:uncharacterized protein (TIGR00369 family)
MPRMAESEPERAGDRPAAPSAPWEEPPRGGYPEPRHFAQPGIDQLRAMLARRAPAPPISRLTGMRVSEAGGARAAFQMPATGWLLSSQGRSSIGPLTMVADGAVACAIQTKLPPATPFTTSELSLRLLRPVPLTGLLTARGRLIQLRRQLALSEVAVLDDGDELIAHGSSLLYVAPQITDLLALGESDDRLPVAAAPDAAAPDNGAMDVDGDPDPWARPPLGEVLPDEVWARMSGLEVFQAQLAGELPMPPIHFLTGLEPTDVAVGEASFTMPATEWLCAPLRGRVQGGAVALLAEAALSGAIQTTIPAGTAVTPVDLKVNYLRPLAADRRRAMARGRVVHSGRRIAVANAEVFDADGKPVAVATGSAMLLPGRPASLAAPDEA